MSWTCAVPCTRVSRRVHLLLLTMREAGIFWSLVAVRGLSRRRCLRLVIRARRPLATRWLISRLSVVSGRRDV